MSLSRVSVTAVRNLHPVTFSPSPRINILYGANGSGKTSVLEAVHLLGLARSFRSTRLTPVIQYEQLACTVFGQVELSEGGSSNLGISRDRQGEFTIRIDGQNARSAAQLAEILPLQLINPDSFRLLEGAPKIRRQFLDWGVFHVEPASWPLGNACRRLCGSGTHGCGMVHLTLFRKRPGTGNCAWPARK